MLHAFGSERAQFVLVNVLVNLAFLLRSYVFMRWLGFAELGMVAVVQTIVLLVGVMQLGILNGGFRLLCGAEGDAARRINDFGWSYVALIAVVGLGCLPLLLTLVPSAGFGLAAFIGVATGLLTLLKTWVSNVLVARASLRRLNLINLLAAIVSLSALLLPSTDRLWLCILSLLLQPLLFVVGALCLDRSLAPRSFDLRRELWRSTLASGFVVFLTSVFQLLNGQMERWFIVSSQGTEALGHYYLALVFVNLYALIPTSLDSIYLPVLVRLHLASQYGELRHALRRFLLVTTVYGVVVAAATFLLARPLLGWLLPGYLSDLRYVYLLLPGLVLFGLSAPFAIVFNVLIEYRYYFLAYGLGSALTAALLVGIRHVYRTADLQALSLAKTWVYIFMGTIIILGHAAICRNRSEFRLR